MIRVQAKTVDGVTRYYPANNAAQALAAIAGASHLSSDVLILVQDNLGLDVEIIYPEPELANVIDFRAAQARRFQGRAV